MYSNVFILPLCKCNVTGIAMTDGSGVRDLHMHAWKILY
jgi:hypothetical protein